MPPHIAPHIEHIVETGSTNADLVARIASGAPIGEGHWLVAERQVAGRGRHGRSWLDAPGNFTGSTVVRIAATDPPVATLSFVTALAVYETVVVHLAEPRRLQLKWPNDLLLDGGKVSGILLEREGQFAIIGIGVNLAAAPHVAGRETASLSQHGPAPDRRAFAQALAIAFEAELNRWRQYGTGPIFSRWLAAAHPLGSRLRVQAEESARIEGIFDGLEPDGALRLRLADGASRVIHAGDVLMGVG